MFSTVGQRDDLDQSMNTISNLVFIKVFIVAVVNIIVFVRRWEKAATRSSNCLWLLLPLLHFVAPSITRVWLHVSNKGGSGNGLVELLWPAAAVLALEKDHVTPRPERLALVTNQVLHNILALRASVLPSHGIRRLVALEQVLPLPLAHRHFQAAARHEHLFPFLGRILLTIATHLMHRL